MAIEVVVGHPHSDIGKGWLTSSIATQMEEPLLIKIDPLLEESNSEQTWIPRDGEFVLEDDGLTYTKRGLRFGPGQQISMGHFLKSTLANAPFTDGQIDKEPYTLLTMADASAYLAADIVCAMERAKTENAVIEVGGSTDDLESKAIPGAIRLLNQKYDTGLVLITKFDSSEVEGETHLKTRSAIRAVDTTMREYWGVPLHALYIRRGNVSEILDDEQLRRGARKVAFKTQLDPQKVTYLPNVKSMEQIDAYTTRFARRNRPQLHS